MIEANEFPDLSRKYRVSAVPQTVFTSSASPEPRILIGGGPPERFLGELFVAARVPPEKLAVDETPSAEGPA